MLAELQKIALITGSAIRIGKYITENLANDGWKIAIHYNSSEQEAYDLAKSLLESTDVILFKADLTQQEQASNLIGEINKQLGPVNLLINNAAIYKNDNISNLNYDLLEQNLQLNLQAPLYLSQAMAKQEINGNIINIIDADIVHNMKKFFSYSLSKKSLFNLTQMLAFSLAPHIRVNAIAPGPILFKEGQNIELFNQLVSDSPLKNKPTLLELYQALQFLINSPSITGQVIYLDGGRHLI